MIFTKQKKFLNYTAYRKTGTWDPKKPGKPGHKNLVGPKRVHKKSGKPEPGTLQKTGTRDPSVTLVGP